MYNIALGIVQVGVLYMYVIALGCSQENSIVLALASCCIVRETATRYRSSLI